MNQLKGIPESMLIPLVARAREFDHANPIIRDELSKEIFNRIHNDYPNIECDKMSQVGISVRSSILDDITQEFVANAENALVINIGCGLDTRFQRFHTYNISWVDLDVPESIQIRKQFFEETAHYKMIAKSMLDDTWITQVKQYDFYNKNADLLFIFEGVLMYFDRQTIKGLLSTIIEQFADHKITFAIEFCSKTIANHTKHHKSVSKLSSQPLFQYGYNQLVELDAILPKQLSVNHEYNYFNFYKSRWGLFGACRYMPFLKNRLNNKIVTMEYNVG